MTPESIEHAIELVNYVAEIARAGGPECTLESLGFDNLDRIILSLEIEERWSVEILHEELTEWTTVADIAATIDRVQRSIAA